MREVTPAAAPMHWRDWCGWPNFRENHRRPLWRGDPDSPPGDGTGRSLLAALSLRVRADGHCGRSDLAVGLSARRGHQRGLCRQEHPGHRALLRRSSSCCSPIKGAATYRPVVILSQIGNAILANNQRRLFAKLMSESVGFFSARHSSEFLARLTAGANSVTQVLNLLINAVGRDLLLADRSRRRDGGRRTLHVDVRLPDRATGDAGAAQAGQAHQGPRPQPVHRHRRHSRDDAGIAAGHPHRQGVHARRNDAGAHRRQHRGGRAQRQQDGARRRTAPAR